MDFGITDNKGQTQWGKQPPDNNVPIKMENILQVGDRESQYFYHVLLLFPHGFLVFDTPMFECNPMIFSSVAGFLSPQPKLQSFPPTFVR